MYDKHFCQYNALQNVYLKKIEINDFRPLLAPKKRDQPILLGVS